MKISDLLSSLNELQATHGDIEIVIPNLTGFDRAVGVEVVPVRPATMEDHFGSFAKLKGGSVEDFPAIGLLTPDESGEPVVVIGRAR